MKQQTFPAVKSCLRISKASKKLKSYCLSKSEQHKTSYSIKLPAKPKANLRYIKPATTSNSERNYETTSCRQMTK